MWDPSELDNGALNIVHDHAGLRISGTGRLFGGPTTLDIRRAGEEKAVTQAQFSVVLDEAARAKAGYALPGVVGPITASVKTQLPLSETETPVELDLTRASLDNLAPGVAKPSGKAAKAQFTLVKRADGMTLDHFTLDAGAMQLSGVVELARDGAFRSAKFSQFRLSPGDDAKFEAQRSGDVLKLTVRGNNVDARPFLRSLAESNGERQAPGAGKGPVSFDDIDLDLKSALVTGYGKQILSNVDFKWERRGNKPRVFSLTGSFGREPLAVALMRNQNGPPQIEISTSDGGSLMSFLALYDRMDSGVLNARVQSGAQGRADGVLHVRDFYLKNEPAMRQLMSQGAPRADDKGVLSFDPESVRVARLQMNFAWAGGRLALSDGIMSGPEMGLLFEGDADITRDTLDISGSYAPLYGLNNLVTNIPLVGPLIAGGAHEGVIALNYRVTGRGQRADCERLAGFATDAWAVSQDHGRNGRHRAPGSAGAVKLRPLQQHMLLLAERQFRHAVLLEILVADRGALVGDGRVIDAQAAALHLTPRLAGRGDEARLDEGRQHAKPRRDFRRAHLDLRQGQRQRAFLEGGLRGGGGLLGGLAPMHQRGRLGRQGLLGLVDLRALQRAEPRDLVQRQEGEQLQEAHDVGVLGVAPILPVVIGRQQIGVEPDRARRRLAHLRAGGGRQQRRGQAVKLRAAHAPAEIDAHDDIAPLVGAAHLQHARHGAC